MRFILAHIGGTSLVTKHRYLAAGMGIVVGSLVVAACGGSNPTPTPRPAATAAPTATSAPQQSPSATPTEAPARPAPGGVAFAFDWQVEDVGEGAKPALALASDGSPRIAFMVEDLGGFVKYAERDGGAWSVTTLDEGHFYGPLDLAVGPGDTPQISWLDHQDSQFRPDKGDAVYAVLCGGEWEITTIAHDGHDGWDNRIAIDAQGRPHISAIDPVDFGGGGVEYYSLQPDGSWVVEQVSSKPQTYRFATSIAIDPQGNPHISYFDGDDRQLILASRGEDGWSETAIEGGNAGIFSSLIIDNEGRFHVSYYQQTSNSGGGGGRQVCHPGPQRNPVGDSGDRPADVRDHQHDRGSQQYLGGGGQPRQPMGGLQRPRGAEGRGVGRFRLAGLHGG